MELIEAVLSGSVALPEMARAPIEALIRRWRELAREIDALTALIWKAARKDAEVMRLMSAPGVGPMTASLFVVKLGDAKRFRSGRQCAAWLGLTPKEEASAEKRRLKAISKAGDEDLRSLLVLGARSVLGQAKRNPARADPWVRQMLRRKPFKVACVALAARTARNLWAMLRKAESYKPRRAPRTIAAAA